MLHVRRLLHKDLQISSAMLELRVEYCRLLLRRLEMIRTTALAVLACGVVLGAAGCDNRGPAEKAGEKVDHTVDTIKNGGHEPVGDSIKDDVNKAREKASDAVDDAKK
jgi:hypothetical protein